MAKQKSTEEKKVYVIVENSFEYNDEYYYRNGDGGVPKLYFTSLKEAEERCDQMNQHARASADPADYSDGYGENCIDDIEFFGVYGITLGE